MNVSVDIFPIVPPGSSVVYRGGEVPFGFLLENGQSVSKLVYPRLFAEIGYTYGGAGDDFNLPDVRGRSDIGSGQGTSLTNRALAATGGEESHVLTTPEMPSHTHVGNPHSHVVTDPGHTHTISTWNAPGGNGAVGVTSGSWPSAPSTSSNATGVSIQNTTASVQNTGGGLAHNNMQPYLVATKMIKF